jgi:hypothetical protein
MQRLVIVVLATAALAGCAGETNEKLDWTRGDGCEEYFSETSRDLANCKAFVAALEAKEKAAGVSLFKDGDDVAIKQGLKKAESTEKTLTE